MTTIATAFQIIIALGIVNVWVLRRNRATAFRPEGAGTLSEEFERYGLPNWMRVAVGTAKLVLAGLLIIGIFFAQTALAASALMSLMMAAAIAAHVRVGDPAVKSAPAFLMFAMSLFVVVAYAA